MNTQASYLFFDLEADPATLTPASFGSVLTNDNFDIIERPSVGFYQKKKNYNKSLIKTVTGKKFGSDPTIFKEKEKYMYDILTQADMNFAFHAQCDLITIQRMYKKYNLQMPLISSYCVKEIHDAVSYSEGVKNGTLFERLKRFDIDTSHLRPHFSVDDAEATRLLLDEICYRLELWPEEIIEKYFVCNYNTMDVGHGISRLDTYVNNGLAKLSDTAPKISISHPLQSSLSKTNAWPFFVKNLRDKGINLTRDVEQATYFVSGDNDDTCKREFHLDNVKDKNKQQTTQKINTQQLCSLLDIESLEPPVERTIAFN